MSSEQEIRFRTRELVVPWKEKKGGLIPILQSIQNLLGYLPPAAMETVAEELRKPLAEVYGVATFYAQFHFRPRGRNIIRVCRGTACHVRGSLKVMNRFKELLGVEDNGTTDDLRFTVEPVACLGACGLAPVITVNEDTHGRMTPDGVFAILRKYE